MHKKIRNEIKNDEKNINEEISKGYFLNHTPLFLAKELYNSNQNVNDEILEDINDSLIELKKDINIKRFLKMKIQIKQSILLTSFGLTRIARVAKVSDHSNLKTLTPKPMIQRLPIALT